MFARVQGQFYLHLGDGGSAVHRTVSAFSGAIWPVMVLAVLVGGGWEGRGRLWPLQLNCCSLLVPVQLGRSPGLGPPSEAS